MTNKYNIVKTHNGKRKRLPEEEMHCAGCGSVGVGGDHKRIERKGRNEKKRRNKNLRTFYLIRRHMGETEHQGEKTFFF